MNDERLTESEAKKKKIQIVKGAKPHDVNSKSKVYVDFTVVPKPKAVEKPKVTERPKTAVVTGSKPEHSNVLPPPDP